MDERIKFMQRCYELAREASLTGNTAVGSIIVRDGVIIGEGRESTKPDHDITRHAEVEAIREALSHTGASKLAGCSPQPMNLAFFVLMLFDTTKLTGLVLNWLYQVVGISSSCPILTTNKIMIWGAPPIVVVIDKLINI